MFKRAFGGKDFDKVWFRVDSLSAIRWANNIVRTLLR